MAFTSKFLYNDSANEGGGADFKPKTQEQADLLNNLRKEAGQEPIPFVAPIEAKVDDAIIDTTKKVEDINKEEGKLQSPVDEVLKTLGLTKVDETTDEIIKIGGAAKVVVKPTVTVTQPTEDELEEAIVLKRLSAKAGREITSIEDFLNPKKEETPEDKAAKLQERENAKLTFGLQNKKVSNKDIESYIADTKNPTEVAYSAFLTSQKEIDPTLTDTDIREKFENKYSLNEEVDSVDYKQGQRDLAFIANTIIKDRHKNYLGLEFEYSNYEKSISDKATYQKELLAKAPIYKSLVEEAAASIKVIEVPFKGKTYKVGLDDAAVNVYAEQMLTPAYSEKMITNGMDKNLIQSAMKSAAISDNFPAIMEAIGNQILLDNQKGQRGIPPEGNRRPLNEIPVGSKKAEAIRELEERLNVQNQYN